MKLKINVPIDLHVKWHKAVLKIFWLVAFISICSNYSIAQPYIYWGTNFNMVFTDYCRTKGSIEIDTTNYNNIWQIGNSSKLLLKSLYPPLAMMTDTINPYPPNNNSSFIFKLNFEKRPCWRMMNLNIDHQIDTDSLCDGGFIETSFDGGKNWLNIAFDTRVKWESSEGYHENDTIKGGIPAFTGRNRFRYLASYYFWHFDRVPGYDSIWFRFTFQSDDIDNKREGWLIGKVSVSVDDCIMNINASDSETENCIVYPNPVVQTSYIRFPYYSQNGRYIQIYNGSGHLVKSFYSKDQDAVPLNRSEFVPGLYYFRVFGDVDVYTSKFIVQ